MAWRQIGDKSLSEPMLTQGRWVNFTQASKVDVTSHDTVWTNYHYISWLRMLQAAIKMFWYVEHLWCVSWGVLKRAFILYMYYWYQRDFHTYALKCIPCYQDLIDCKAKVFQMLVCQLLARYYLMKLLFKFHDGLWLTMDRATRRNKIYFDLYFVCHFRSSHLGENSHPLEFTLQQRDVVFMLNINFDDTCMTVPYLDIMLFMWMLFSLVYGFVPSGLFTKEVNPRLANHPLETDRRLANLELTSLVKDATDVQTDVLQHCHSGDHSY